MTVRFTQSCPTCGRRVEIRATLSGCTVACQHCKAEFVAEPCGKPLQQSDTIQRIDASDDLMSRVDELLQRTDAESTIS